MLITGPKPYEELLSFVKNKTVIISCNGCREVYFPEKEAAAMHERMLVSGTALAVIETGHVCNDICTEAYYQKYSGKIEAADTLLVFSCGVGVQAVAGKYIGMPVYSGCDTYPLPGHQGLDPPEYDCAGCGECRLNMTGGICPVTACSKSLINGQCGGSKNGKCEVDKEMECGWERINMRLKQEKRK